MPRPEGWTDADVRARDKCVEGLLLHGVPEGRSAEEQERTPRERAYAICTVMVERRKHSKPNPDPKDGGAYRGYMIEPHGMGKEGFYITKYDERAGVGTRTTIQNHTPTVESAMGIIDELTG